MLLGAKYRFLDDLQTFQKLRTLGVETILPRAVASHALFLLDPLFLEHVPESAAAAALTGGGLNFFFSAIGWAARLPSR